MTTREMYLLLDTLLPPWFIVALGVFAAASSIVHVWLRREPRVLVFVAGSVSFVFVYSWPLWAEPTFVQRAVVGRLSIAIVLVCIAIYNERAWPWLSDFLKRVWKRTKCKLRKGKASWNG